MTEERRKRLRLDHDRLRKLCELNEGLIEMEFDPLDSPPEKYRVTLHCRGVRRIHGEVVDVDEHRIGIYLMPEYPDREPFLQWETPIFHPNVQAPGVCLFGQWDSRVTLDSVCIGLWDMARYQLVNIDNAWNDWATAWLKERNRPFPLDRRTLKVLPPDESLVPVATGKVIRIEAPL